MSSTRITRRNVLKYGAMLGTALAAPALIQGRALGADPIKVGFITDLTGPIGASGQAAKPGLEFAVKRINENGGLLGRPLEIIAYDAQSNIQLYTQYAQQLVMRDNVDIIFGATSSSAREAIRPIFTRQNKLYFYNGAYEGGVCDRNTFCFGTTPGQTMRRLVPHAVEKWGKKVYVLGADYNYGQITAKWMTKYATDAGAEILGSDFFPLDVADFSSTIARIQGAQPDLILEVLVGSNHLGFYRQWEAAGLKNSIPIAAAAFGVSSELLNLDTSTTEGILTSFGFYDTVETETSQDFVDAMRQELPDSVEVTEVGTSHYEAVTAWAKAVELAGTLDRDSLIDALESGLSIDGPTGRVTIDPQTHHTVRSIYLGQAKGGKWDILDSYADQPPVDTAMVCDLQANPDTNTQFVIDI